LLKQEKDIVILDWNGGLVTCLNSPVSRSGSIRISQYQTYCDEQKRLGIAKSLIKAKIQNSLLVLTWIKSNRRSFRYNNVIEKYLQGIDYAKDIGAVRGIEGDVAQWYWDAVTSIIDDKFEFESRSGQRKPRNAIDPVNALLNYGYSVLESEVWKAVNKVGLDAYVGFLHENYNNKASLVYDLMEPFRWLVDITVVKIALRRLVKKKDFIETNEGNVRLRPNAVKLLLNELGKLLGTRVIYKNKKHQWSSIIEIKTRELMMYIDGRLDHLDFIEPNPNYNSRLHL